MLMSIKNFCEFWSAGPADTLFVSLQIAYFEPSITEFCALKL